jgi:hypothetical protein
MVRNKEEYLIWDEGNISGTREIVDKAKKENNKEHGLLDWGTSEKGVKGNYLKYVIPAYLLIKDFVLDGDWSGDVPYQVPNVVY